MIFSHTSNKNKMKWKWLTRQWDNNKPPSPQPFREWFFLQFCMHIFIICYIAVCSPHFLPSNKRRYFKCHNLQQCHNLRKWLSHSSQRSTVTMSRLFLEWDIWVNNIYNHNTKLHTFFHFKAIVLFLILILLLLVWERMH